MNKPSLYLPLAILTLALAGCTTPKKDGSDLKAEIDASRSGHYGQAMMHEEMAEEQLETANNVLKHIEQGHYWNINEKPMALAAAKSSADHRLASEKEMCLWLTEVHSPNHHLNEATQKTVAYFKSGKAVPFKVEESSVAAIGHWLEHHPDATATVSASTDTVGKPTANQKLSEQRANNVGQLLIKEGAKASQLTLKATGEAAGPDNKADQKNRVAIVITSHPQYADCANLK